MKTNLAMSTVLALGLMAGCASQQSDEFDAAVVGLGAQFQALRRLENEMNRTPGADQREDLRKRWRESRLQMNDMLARARAAANTDKEQQRIGQLAALADQADARMMQIPLISQLKETR